LGDSALPIVTPKPNSINGSGIGSCIRSYQGVEGAGLWVGHPLEASVEFYLREAFQS